MAQTQHRLDYARGLVEAQELTENERRDRAIAALIEQVGDLTEAVERLTAEVERLRGGEAPARSVPRAWCPGCGAAIPLPVAAGGPLEVACGRCGSVLEVV